jgi:nitrite reductase/ring-hydroxylating ferredoxin subunit
VTSINLGPSAAVAAGCCKEYTISLNGEDMNLFVVHHQGQFFAYQNHCPHTGISLNWQADQFLDYSQSRIQCSMHGALFRIDDGYCEWGPCLGQSLQRLTVEEQQGQLLLVV